MKKLSKKELIEKVLEIEKQIRDKKVKLAFRTLLTKYDRDPKSLKIKDIEAILELANNDDVFEEKEVEPNYREIFKDEISYSELEKNNVFKKQDLTFDGIKELHRSGNDEVFLISHWSPFDLETFNYSGTREVPEELCRQFEKDIDILRVVHVEQYKDVLFTESVLTGATFTFLACDFQKTEKGCRFSEGLPFEVYKIVEQPRHRKRASKK